MIRHSRCAGGIQRGFEVGEFFRLFDKVPEIIGKAPEIIDKAAQSQLALFSLIVIVLGIVAAFLFRNTTGRLLLAAFTSFLGFLVFVVVLASISTNPVKPSGDSNSKTDRIPEAETCEHYAASAFADYKRMMEIPKCQDYTTFFPYRWQSTYQNYLDWCKRYPSWLANWEREQRDAHLKQCEAS